MRPWIGCSDDSTAARRAAIGGRSVNARGLPHFDVSPNFIRAACYVDVSVSRIPVCIHQFVLAVRTSEAILLVVIPRLVSSDRAVTNCSSTCLRFSTFSACSEGPIGMAYTKRIGAKIFDEHVYILCCFLGALILHLSLPTAPNRQLRTL